MANTESTNSGVWDSGLSLAATITTGTKISNHSNLVLVMCLSNAFICDALKFGFDAQMLLAIAKKRPTDKPHVRCSTGYLTIRTLSGEMATRSATTKGSRSTVWGNRDAPDGRLRCKTPFR